MMDPTVDQQPARVMRAEARERLAALPMLPGLQWQLDPTEEGLEGSKWRTELPTPFCVALGRRLLLAELEFSEWVLRRVEKVAFERDRSVSRAITIDLLVREDAPMFVDRHGRRHWLI